MIIIILVLFLLLLPILFFPKCKHSEQNVDCLIVLGCPAYGDGTMSITQKLRVEKAAESILKHKIKVCILTGGAAHNEYTEAKIMADYLKTLVDCKLILEDKSRTTYENMKNCQTLCKENKFTKIGVLTSSFHSDRAYAMSKKFFDDVIMFNAPYRFTIKKIIREYISRMQYITIEIKNKLK